MFVRHLPAKPNGTHVKVPADMTQVKIQKAYSNNINIKRGQQPTTVRDTIINCNSDGVPLSTFSLGRTSLSAPLPSTFGVFLGSFKLESRGPHQHQLD